MKKKKIYVVICMTLILLGVLGTTALAEGGARRDNIKSHGNIDVQNGTAAIYSSDFIYLADEIDTLENAYKTNTVAALNTMGTYYDSNGAVTHNQDDEGITSEAAVNLTFSQIYNGVLRSQSVDHLSDQQATDGTGSLLYYADEAAKNDNNLVTTTTTTNDFPLLIQPITADNLTAGTAAWVDGSLIIGNGADNQAYYNIGYTDGYAQKLDNVSVAYNYHEHIGTSENGDGCYTKPHILYGQGSTYVYANYTNDNGTTYHAYACRDCGKQISNYRDDQYSSPPPHNNCPAHPYQSGWELGCGKTTSTIESATIIFCE